jgi:predicted enzyme related to lactoylglutathione lyase
MATFTHYEEGTPSWVELSTSDQAAAKAFYGALFGWSFQDNDMGEMGHYYIGQLEGSDIAGVGGQQPGMDEHPPYWGVYLAVDDVDATTAKVAAAGGTVEAGPFDVTTAGRMSAIQDPTGAHVGLWQAGETVGTQRANEPGTPTWNECVTSDPERALAFYSEILGLTAAEMDMGEGGTYRVLSNAAGKQVGGMMMPQMEGVPPHWNVYFHVADADASVSKVKELGGDLIVPPFEVPDIGKMGLVSDPQGASFWVMQPVPGAPAQA